MLLMKLIIIKKVIKLRKRKGKNVLYFKFYFYNI